MPSTYKEIGTSYYKNQKITYYLTDKGDVITVTHKIDYDPDNDYRRKKVG